MNWIDAEIELPTQEGKYVVRTVTIYGIYFKSYHVLEVKFSYNTKNQPVWGCSNQKVIQWLKE